MACWLINPNNRKKDPNLEKILLEEHEQGQDQEDLIQGSKTTDQRDDEDKFEVLAEEMRKKEEEEKRYYWEEKSVFFKEWKKWVKEMKSNTEFMSEYENNA